MPRKESRLTINAVKTPITSKSTSASKTGGKGLGKGLSALMGNSETVNDVVHSNRKKDVMSLSDIQPNPDQPRKNFAEDGLATLMESIKQHGIVQPIIVRKMDDHYQIVAGERRYRAALALGLIEVPVVIKNYSTEEMTEIALVENLQRQDLDPIEEAFAYERLIDAFKQTQEVIASRLGRSRSHVANMMRLLKLPEGIRNDLSAGELSVGQARPLLSLKTEELKLEAAEIIKEGELSARQVEQLVKTMAAGKIKQPPVKPQDSAEVRALVDQLKLSLGSPVAIKLRPGKEVKGKIEIAFSSESELERLISYMNHSEDSTVMDTKPSEKSGKKKSKVVDDTMVFRV